MTGDLSKCPECGTTLPAAGSKSCDGCGYVRYGSVTLTCEGTGKSLTVAIDTEVTKYLLAETGSEDAKFSSPCQFRLYRDRASLSWVVAHDASATNPTYLNGAALVAPSAMADGDILSIGPDRMKLRVGIVV